MRKPEPIGPRVRIELSTEAPSGGDSEREIRLWLDLVFGPSGDALEGLRIPEISEEEYQRLLARALED